MNAFEQALERSNSRVNTTRATAMRLKQEGGLSELLTKGPMSSFSAFREQGANRQRYGLFRGWLYSAVHAICSKGAGQPVHVGRIVDAVDMEEEERSRRFRTKSHLMSRMPSGAKMAVEHGELEHDPANPFLKTLAVPNPIQNKWEFSYSFLANLCLTGWSFVMGGQGEGGKQELYSLPTTWVQPDHKEGPFSRFKIRDPSKPNAGSDDDWFTRDQVSFAYLPNPSNPLGALAPATSQTMSIKIDDHIQASQEAFFDNGIFPSVVVSVGREPHPDVPKGIRPRLTAVQRRQVDAAIKKVMRGVANYGNPAIIDGMIDSITRLSATQNEMGWDKSEDKIRARIMSAFGVHDFILGMPVKVGGYAQVFKIEENFFGRVNTLLDMLGIVVSEFAPEEGLLAWWEECVPRDPEIERKQLETGRKNGDITRDEFRSRLGFPPWEGEEEGNRNKLLDSVGGFSGAIQLMEKIGSGSISEESAAQLMSLFLEIPIEDARERVGTPRQDQALEEAVRALRESVELLKKPVEIEVKTAS